MKLIDRERWCGRVESRLCFGLFVTKIYGSEKVPRREKHFPYFCSVMETRVDQCGR